MYFTGILPLNATFLRDGDCRGRYPCDLDRLLGHDAIEHPLVLQLGGSQPDRLAIAVERAAGRGFVKLT